MCSVPSQSEPSQRAHRHQTGHAFCGPTHPRFDQRDSRTESINRRTGHSCGSASVGPARDRPDHRRPGIHCLVPPRPMPQRSSLRSSRRRRSPPSLIRATHPPPTKPLWRPDPQSGYPHHRYHPLPGLSQNPGLHSQTNQRRKNHPRSPPLPETVHRPTPVPTPPKPAPNPAEPAPPFPSGNAVTPPQAQNPTPHQNPDLVNIEASGGKSKAPIRSHPLFQGNFSPPGREQADRSQKRHQAEFQSGQTRPGLRAHLSIEWNFDDRHHAEQLWRLGVCQSNPYGMPGHRVMLSSASSGP